MKKILINFAHPAKRRSTINKALRASVEGLEGVTVNDLYANYPNFLIDVKREQKLCEDHDIIIFQFPFYWYSTPAIMKEWQDLVLEHGWAYGSKAKALKGKYFLLALTGGGAESTYQRDGSNHYYISELTSPMRGMTRLCKMTWLPPFVVLGIHQGLCQEEVTFHAENYRKTVIGLRDGTIDLDLSQELEFISGNTMESEVH